MLPTLASTSLIALLATNALARDVPANVKALYDSIVGAGSCSNILQGGFYSKENDTKDFCYCGDHLADKNVIYLQGNGGQLVNMDIDCDGFQSAGNGDCKSSTDTQVQTTFSSIVAGYGKGISDVDAYIHSYVVLGNQGTKDGYVNFDPQSVGIQPLSLVAVVCGDKLIYGVWADTNGDDGPPLVGEASLSLGQACYGTAVNGGTAHDPNDVLYIAFAGSNAVPGADGANWAATSYDDFEASLASLGDSLVANL